MTVLVAVAAFLFVATMSAVADVHVVSQAGCGVSGNSGATASQGAIANGRPLAPIPVNAGGNIAFGEGGNLDGMGGDCDAPGDVRQNP